MRIYLAIKFYEDYSNRKFIESLANALEQNKHEIVCTIRDLDEWGKVSYTPKELMKKSFEMIDDCDMILVELSEKGVGVGIEVGYAWAKGKPIITIAKEGSDVPSTLEGISEKVFCYKNIDELVLFLKRTWR